MFCSSHSLHPPPTARPSVSLVCWTWAAGELEGKGENDLFMALVFVPSYKNTLDVES